MNREYTKSDMSISEIGNRILTRRKELNFTLQQIADKVGVASSTIQRYEKGSISNFKLPVIESIAKALNFNPVWLIRKDAKKETTIKDEFFYGKKYKEYVAKRATLINYFEKLNSLGQDEAIKRISELTEINKYINSATDEIAATKDNVINVCDG